jgi:alanyl-tRNA synthetase
VNTDQTIKTFTEYFRERGHQVVRGHSLVPPPGDPVLFTTSGMHPLTPYLLGRPHLRGRRLTGVQRCLRTTDLDEVGDDTHLTVFQMLGSWSLGDYGGAQSLRWGYELLRDGFGIASGRLHATVFGGDGQVGPDLESLHTWRELGVPVEGTTRENWWSNGPTGPCGPDSEIFVWTGGNPPRGTPTTDPGWVEVWNHVMMRYLRHDDGSLEPLPRHGIDTGLGLERLAAVLQGKRSVYETDTFEPWMRRVAALWDLGERDLRVVCDHLRSGIVVVGDGVTPSNTGRGYVLRRLTRRVLTVLWRQDPTRTLVDLPEELVRDTLDRFGQGGGAEGAGCGVPGVHEVREIWAGEERRFSGLLERGRRVLSQERFSGPLGEEEYGYLHETHGLPREWVDGLIGG